MRPGSVGGVIDTRAPEATTAPSGAWDRLGGWEGLLHLASRLVPGGLLLWAGWGKAFDRQGTILSVDAYDVLPDAVVTPVAAMLPWLEIVLGLFLVAGLFVRFAGISTAALILVFIVGMGQAKARGLAIDCGCFGAGSATGKGVTWWDIIRDIPLFAMGAYLAWRPRGQLRLDAFIEEREAER